MNHEEMRERYMLSFAAAYYRGMAKRTGAPQLSQGLLNMPLERLNGEQMVEIVSHGCEIKDRLYYFKRTHEQMPRVKKVLGFLRSISFESLLDVGSGRGVFLLPFMELFPWVTVTSVDVLAHRVEFLRDLHDGGVAQLQTIQADICSAPIEENSIDVVTMLEVLEHIPQVQRAVENAVRIARKYVVVSVPSKPDDNPEHIHLLTKEALTAIFAQAGCTRLHFDGVNGHLILVAAVGNMEE